MQCLYGTKSFRECALKYPVPSHTVRSPRLSVRGTTNHPFASSNSSTALIPPEADDSITPEQKKKSALETGPIIHLDHSLASSYGLGETLFAVVKDLFEAIVENKAHTGVVAPVKLVQVVKKRNALFRSSMHQDAHEFFIFLVNEIIENGNTWMRDIFEGLLTSEIKCLTCEGVTMRNEKFLDLSIDIEQNCSVSACLHQFSASELLCGSNKFHCDSCGGLQEAELRTRITRAPEVLTLHLKRFKFTEDVNTKLLYRVVYPLQLRLFDSDVEDLYELYAVVVHVGGGPYHGHYVAIVKTDLAGWVLFDDEIAERVEEEYVRNFGNKQGMASAYILFYQRASKT